MSAKEKKKEELVPKGGEASEKDPKVISSGIIEVKIKGLEELKVYEDAKRLIAWNPKTKMAKVKA